ncbi:MAG: PfkB family carbohydrate kinase [Chloroflexota bacterium]
MTVDYVTFSNLIIDDIVFPDGQSRMNTLGGSGTHALVGMMPWNQQLGYAAAVGADLNQAHRDSLNRFGVNTDGLVVRKDYKTARAWQIFEEDDTRIEIFRTSHEEFRQRKVLAEDLPSAYLSAKGFHFQWGTSEELYDIFDFLKKQNSDMKLILEVGSGLKLSPGRFKELCPQLALFSPDRDEGFVFAGTRDPHELCDIFIRWGVPVVAVRMGASGSLLKTRDGSAWMLPAVPTNIVDVTGAGNSFIGGFMTGLGDGLSPLEAGLRAAVSASFALEQIGLPQWDAIPVDEANKRLAWAREQVRLA